MSIQPIYIYRKESTDIFGPIDYFIVHDLIHLNKFACFLINFNYACLHFEASITNLYFDSYNKNLYSYLNNISNDSLSFIPFTELLELMNKINENRHKHKSEMIKVLQLVLANWEHWYQ